RAALRASSTSAFARIAVMALGGKVAKCNVWTAPALQEENLTSERSVRVQPCIRPFDAAALAAGPDVIRWSGPTKSTRSFLAWHFTGFPIDGLDRFASTSSSPLQFVNSPTQPHPPVARLTLPPDEVPGRFHPSSCRLLHPHIHAPQRTPLCGSSYARQLPRL